MTETTKEQRDELRRLHAGVDSPVLATRSDALAAAIADAERLAEVEVALQEEKQRLLDDADIDDGTAVAGAKRMAACRLQRILDGGKKDE